MFESMIKLRERGKHHLVVIALVALMAVEALSLAALIQAPSQPLLVSYGEEQGTRVSQPILKISEIRGPRIDDTAAMVVVTESAESGEASCATPPIAPACATLPLSLWVFLLAAYVALLLFNFSSPFARATKPQWFLEVFLTLLAVGGWYVLDGCRAYNWFPFAIVKTGLIIFALYVYVLEKKLLAEREKRDRTESMF